MFETDTDVDFGDEFTFNFDNKTSNKRSIEAPLVEISKKSKSVGPTNVVKRKFPGPAGLLPDKPNLLLLQQTNKNSEEIPCSQMTVSVFEDSPWIDVCKDFGAFINKYDIKWIKTNADLQKLPNQQAPFLAALIKHIECLDGKYVIVKIILKDLSGEIQGTVIHNLYEKYSECLVPGSVIVLRQCGVLSTNSNSNHYLTITGKNLINIYWKNKEDFVKIKVQDCEELPKIITNENLLSQKEIELFEEALDGVDVNSFLDDF